MIKLDRYRIIFASVLAILFSFVLISACNNIIGIGGADQQSSSSPTTFGILAPVKSADNVVANVLKDSQVQIQSAHQGTPSRIELWVQQEGGESKIIRSDPPADNGVALQAWTPDRIGRFTVKVIAYVNGSAQDPHTIQVEVIDSLAVSVSSEGDAVADVPVQREMSPTPDGGAAFQAPTATSIADVVIAAATPTPFIPTPTPTPVPPPTPTAFYPPPPPAPGVPPGPTQKQLPKLMPPVCDAAKFIDVFVPNTSQRVSIIESDGVPAKTVGGTLVHRAWRLQNIGTCTWGLGYELAFYGGRSMGSGGVAFEAFFPNEPDRRNIIGNTDRLIAPEGQPNQVAALEVLLKAPVTPGVHQSYWRMRNPHGVYFGPILGVTLEVVRDCDFGIYGAPVINKFEILGVGNVFRPVDPVHVQADVGESVTLDWNIINAENYDIIVRDPIGNAANMGTNNRADRNAFIPTRLGEHRITLYADNGPCTASVDVIVDVVPPEGNPDFFVLEANQSGIHPADTDIRWRHLDNNVDRIDLIVERYERVSQTRNECTYQCEALGGISCPGWSPDLLKPKKECKDVIYLEDWRKASGETLPSEIILVSGEDLPSELTLISSAKLIDELEVTIVDKNDGTKTIVSKGTKVATGKQVGGKGNAQASAVVSNINWGLCPASSESNKEVGIKYYLRAFKKGEPASPPVSNSVDLICRESSPTLETLEKLPVELQGFNP